MTLQQQWESLEVDQNGNLPNRVQAQVLANALPVLNATYANKPAGIADGQVPVWQASTSQFIPGAAGAPNNLDGGNATSVYTGTFNFDGGSAT